MKNVIPPVLFLICIVLMIAIRAIVVVQKIIPDPFNYLGIVLIVIGLLMTIKVRKAFNKENTEIHTFKRPKKLVTNGLFKISRNPIYLGFAISIVGVWILLGTLLPIIGFLIFIFVSNFWYIPFEEGVMEQTFGAEYTVYRKKVRRWI